MAWGRQLVGSGRQQCQELADYLNKEGISAQALHGDMEQRERDQVLALFANQSCSVLTATDVAARGIDIAGVAAVINVELAADPAAHVHRIGRSGRAGQPGLALSLVAPRELKRLRPIEEAYGELNWQDIERLPERPDRPLIAPMRTLAVAGGRKDKLRPGDLANRPAPSYRETRPRPKARQTACPRPRAPRAPAL